MIKNYKNSRRIEFDSITIHDLLDLIQEKLMTEKYKNSRLIEFDRNFQDSATQDLIKF